MKYRTLGPTDIKVSTIGLGTMTWGTQNSEAEAHQQLDYAVAHGVNLIDAAEMYPVPPSAETQGRTESCIGSWLKQRGKRDDVLVATKIAGPAEWLEHVRGGRTVYDLATLEAAVDASLARLQTDYIDLYQLHWPERNTNFFGRLGYTEDEAELDFTPLEEVLTYLGEIIRSGKVRHIGVSNETPWGVMRYCMLAEYNDLPRMFSIQNPYNLLNRSFEVGLAEVALREWVGLLAYSPLGFGVLTGKYLDGQRPDGARLTMHWERYGRYSKPHAEAAVRKYCDLAREHGLTPTQLALAFVNSRPFLTSNLVGATTMEQLAENIASIDIELAPEALEAIEAIHTEHPNPCP